MERGALRKPFSLYPRGKMYGVFDSLEQVRDLTERLLDLGLQMEKVEILEGEEGIESLDPDGRHHGIIARLIRAIQTITDERDLAVRYVRELLSGRYVVAVSLPNDRQMFEQTCRAFRDSGGHAVNYYGLFVTEQLSA